jgi:hypothetical protein
MSTHNYIKNIIVAHLLFTIPLGAYTYTFHNFIDKEIEVHFKLVGGIAEPIETIRIPAAVKDTIPSIASRSFEWFRALLCTEVSTFQVKILPDGTFVRPYFLGTGSMIGFQEALQEFLRTRWLTARAIEHYKKFNAHTMQDFVKIQVQYEYNRRTCGSIISFYAARDGYPVMTFSSGV